MQLNHCEQLDIGKIRFINSVCTLLGFTGAMSSYVISSYFKMVSGSDNVGPFYFVTNFFVILCLLNFSKLVNRFGKKSAFLIMLLAHILLLSLLSLLVPSYISALFLMTSIITSLLVLTVKDIILESCSLDQESGRIKGGEMTLYNLGFIFGPLISTYILERYGYNKIFLLQALIFLFIFISSQLKLGKINHNKKIQINIRGILMKAKARRDFILIYFSSLVCDIFYAVMVVFSPIYMLERGFSWKQIGMAFTIMLIPFVIVEYPIGYLADKKFGEKKMMIGALILMSITTFAFGMLSSSDIRVWAGVLFATRIGAAMLDILRNSYFYKRVDGEDFELIDLFMTSSPTAYLIVSIVTSIFLLFFPLQYLFILLSFVLLFGLIPMFKLENNKPGAV